MAADAVQAASDLVQLTQEACLQASKAATSLSQRVQRMGDSLDLVSDMLAATDTVRLIYAAQDQAIQAARASLAASSAARLAATQAQSAEETIEFCTENICEELQTAQERQKNLYSVVATVDEVMSNSSRKRRRPTERSTEMSATRGQHC